MDSTSLRPDSVTAQPSPPASFDSERLSVTLILAAVAAMIAISWRKWPDPLIDFGTELYVPWRLHEGDILYRDIAHPYAPVSPYVNLGWFKLLGVSMRSLVIGNGLLFVSLLAMLYTLLRKIATLTATTTALLLVVLVFAFGQYISFGNYNYLTPYSHEMTHGLVLSLIALTALAHYFETPSLKALGTCGLAVGLVFLTKYDVFFAILGASGIGLCLFWRRNRQRLRHFEIAVVVAAAFAGPLACWALLSAQLPAMTSLRATMGAFPLLFSKELLADPFFAQSAGLARPWVQLGWMAGWTMFYVLTTLPAALFGREEPRLDDRLYVFAAALLPAVGLSLVGTLLPWDQALVPLPFFLTISTILTARSLFTSPNQAKPGEYLRLVLLLFSLLLLLKTPLASRIAHYGFALAMPGTALMVVAALDAVPPWLTARGLRGSFYRVAVLSLFTIFAGFHLQMASSFFSKRIYSLGEHGDATAVDERGSVVAKAVEIVRAHVGKSETLVVFPEGGMVNYLARRRSSIPVVVFNPPALAMHGEQRVLDDLAAHPPDYILAFSREVRDLREHGCAAFGKDCAQRLVAWMNAGYRPQVVVESEGRRLVTLLGRAPTVGSVPRPEVIEAFFPR